MAKDTAERLVETEPTPIAELVVLEIFVGEGAAGGAALGETLGEGEGLGAGVHHGAGGKARGLIFRGAHVWLMNGATEAVNSD